MLSNTQKIALASKHGHRPIVGYLQSVFNQVDRERLREVGPDRLCAEWVLKNGGAVRLSGQLRFLFDYNDLPVDTRPIRVRNIDASRSKINALGFDHLQGCKHINRLILNDCTTLSDAAMDKLVYVKDSLSWLQVSRCPGITDKGLMPIGALTNLKYLMCFSLPNVKQLETICLELQQMLANCKIKTSPHADNEEVTIE